MSVQGYQNIMPSVPPESEIDFNRKSPPMYSALPVDSAVNQLVKETQPFSDEGQVEVAMKPPEKLSTRLKFSDFKEGRLLKTWEKIIGIAFVILGWFTLGMVLEVRQEVIKYAIEHAEGNQYYVWNYVWTSEKFEYLESLHRKFPENTRLAYALARLYERQGKLSESFHAYTKAIDSLNKSNSAGKNVYQLKNEMIKEQNEIARLISEKDELAADEVLILTKYDYYMRTQPRLSARCVEGFLEAFVAGNKEKRALWARAGACDYNLNGKCLGAVLLGETKEKKKILKAYAEDGHPLAKQALGAYTYTEDKEQGFKYLKEAAELGCDFAYQNLGICYEFGGGTEKNIPMAIDSYEKFLKKYPNDEKVLKRLGSLLRVK